MRVLLIFVDGIGLGEKNPATNPFVKFGPNFFHYLLGEPLHPSITGSTRAKARMAPTDACLGIPGLPQSATGQTALLTGVNAARLIGHHVTGFPGPKLRDIISQHGIMLKLKAKGFKVTSANMYTPDYLELVARRKRRHSATTLTILGAGVPLRSVPELKADKAVYQDITNEMLAANGYAVPIVSPAAAAQRLIAIAAEHDFTLFEYFQTDRCGHKQDFNRAQRILTVLSEFFCTIYCHMLADMLVVITSDHGNFEDLSVKTHTYNSVPTIAFGDKCQEFSRTIHSLTDITPAIIAILEGKMLNDRIISSSRE